MSLTAGARLGPYEIVSALGAGGMGEVYRATDTNLKRSVAIKVLPASVAGGAERLARFQREAEVLASLNHPNIAQIHGLEKSDGTIALVMELVEGEDLSQRIARGPIPVDEALPIAKQIAEALEAAHEQGIIHRDLKPANIKVRPDGTVKVLDFGLAKLTEPSVASTTGASPLTMSPTITSPAMMTGVGVLLGTVAYMSPEQARGKTVDKRADIWAFGAVLFEMLSGRRAFEGEDIAETIGAVIHKEPAWTQLPAGTPTTVRSVLQRCLQKDPRKRLRDISSVELLLELAPTEAGRRRLLPWFVAGAAAVVALVALLAPRPSPPPGERPLVRLDVDLGSDVSLASLGGTDVIISPDGSRLVFVSLGRLFTRRLDQPKAVELADTTGAYAPFFSPDGKWVGFFAPGQLKKISVEGGAAVTLCGTFGRGGGGSFSEDGTIIASLDGATLSRIPEAGGTPTKLLALAEGESQHRWPQVLPGGKAVLFSVRPASGTYDDGRIDLLTLRDGRRTTLQRGGMFGRYLATSKESGYLLYVTKGTVFAMPLELDRLDMRGTPSPVLEDVSYNSTMGAAQIDASQNGTLVYRGELSGGLVTVQWLDASGQTELLPAKSGIYAQPVLSSDGKQLALSIASGGGQDIWVYDWQRDAMSRLTFGGGTFSFPVWHPGDRHIVFTGGNGGGGMFWTRADGASRAHSLTQSTNGQFPWSFSPDGTRLAFAEFPAGKGGDIWTVPVETEGAGLKAGKPEVFLQTPASELYPAFSPDGRWIAYRSNESGVDEIYVRAFPDKGGKWLISNNGGVVAVWSRNGHELFYRTVDQHIMVVPYAVTGDVFVPDKPRLWTEKRLADVPLIGRNLDIAPDGKRFVALMPASAPDEQKAQSHVIFLQNFADELRRRVSGSR